MWLLNLLTMLFITLHLFREIQAEDDDAFFLKAHKNIPRIGRDKDSKNMNDEFEAFFKKASKSVPRIGRRNELDKYGDNNNVDNDQPELKMGDKQFKNPTWLNIADAFEYHPELLTSPELMARLQQQMIEDPSVYEWDKMRMKRALPLTNNS